MVAYGLALVVREGLLECAAHLELLVTGVVFFLPCGLLAVCAAFIFPKEKQLTSESGAVLRLLVSRLHTVEDVLDRDDEGGGIRVQSGKRLLSSVLRILGVMVGL